MSKKKKTATTKNLKQKKIGEERKELIKKTKDKIHNISRANKAMGGQCIVCGKEIKKNQAFRALPSDRNCQEERLYHKRTCGPGSENWKLFKANGKKTPEKSLPKGQLSFKWKLVSKK
jgi:hypothetical protein